MAKNNGKISSYLPLLAILFVFFGIATFVEKPSSANDAGNPGGTPNEVRVAEFSRTNDGLGSIIPASCESTHGGGECIINSLYVSPSTIDYGGGTTVYWSTTGMTYCDLYRDGGLWLSGLPVSSNAGDGPLYANRNYTLVCYSGSGTGNSANTTVSVNGPPTINSFSASPNPVEYNGNPSVSWSSSNTHLCDLYWDGGFWTRQGTSGSLNTGTVTSNHSLGIYCWNSASAASSGFTLSVNSAPAIISFSASPNPVGYGGNPSVSWSSSNTSYCDLYWDGAYWTRQGTSGSLNTGAITSNHSVAVDCYNGAGASISSGLTITVSGPSVSISASPTTIHYGNSSTISWTPSNSGSCTASGDWSGAKDASSGTHSQSTGALNALRTWSYGISCSGNGTTPTQTATVSVTNTAPNNPSISGPSVGNPRLASEPSGNQGANVHVYYFNISATDPDSDQVRYAIDWDANGTVDERLPTSGYVNSGTTLTASHSWPTTGDKTFQVYTEDNLGGGSAWVQKTITINYECNDGIDNDGDGYNNSADPGCHPSDSLWDNSSSYSSSDNNESDEYSSTCNDHANNNATSSLDCADPVCHVNNDPTKACDVTRQEGVFNFTISMRAKNAQGIDLKNLFLPPGRPFYIEWTTTGTPTDCTMRKKELEGNIVRSSSNILPSAETAGTHVSTVGNSVTKKFYPDPIHRNSRFEITCGVNTSVIGITDVRVGRIGSF